MAKKSKKNFRRQQPFLTIAIGTSAGGPKALKEFFSGVKNNPRMALIVIQHLDEAGEKIALNSLRRLTSMKAEELISGMTIQRGHVYMVPPHQWVSFVSGKAKLATVKTVEKKLSVIDHLFTAVAKEFGDTAVGVLLSGHGKDGAVGMKAINEFGGFSLIQDPQTAEHPSMPESAALNSPIDKTLAPAKMWKEILSYAHYLENTGNAIQREAFKDQIASALPSICDILHKKTRHDFKHYKTSTLVRRIQRRMQVLQLESVADYIDTLVEKSDEIETLFKELLINITSFFRDPDAFEALKDEVLKPLIRAHKPHQKIRIWVAGCSTGEEAYSLAVMMRELIDQQNEQIEVQIIATDLDDAALAQARRGNYSGTITEHVSPEHLARYFVKRGGRYSVTKELREMCLFSIHNLIVDPPFSQIDLISCRNVLIYLGPHLQKKLFPVFHYALRSNGYLFLGNSETLTSHKELFKPINSRYRIAQRKPTAIKLPSMSTSVQNYLSHFQDTEKATEADLNLIGQRIALDEMPLRYAVVNEEAQVLSSSAGFTKYVQIPEGTFQNNIMKLVNPSLRAPLRSAFNLAKKEKRKVTNDACTIKTDQGLERTGIIVQPMPQLGDMSELFWVAFHNLGLAHSKDAGPARLSDERDAELIEQLERDLTVVRQELDKSVQDLEASNEELKSSNEELLSMNEELQSANEELEASKEEVQDSNEALHRANTDLENLLSSTQIATLFLDDDLRIRGFTPAIGDIYNIQHSDIGRSITDFTLRAKTMEAYPDLTQLEDGKPHESEVILPDDRIFLRRILPYRNSEGRHEGSVVTFIDVSALRRSEGRFLHMANSVPVIAWTTDAQGNVEFFNERWYQYTGQTSVRALGWGWSEAVHPDDLVEALKTWKAALNSEQNYEAEYRLRQKEGGYRWHRANGIPVRGSQGHVINWFGTCVDIDDQLRMQNRIEQAHNELNRFLMQAPDPMVKLSGPNHIFTLVNPPYIEFIGSDPTHKSVREVFTDDQAAHFFELLDRVYTTGVPFVGKEIPFKRHNKNGTTDDLYIDVSYDPSYDVHGNINGISAFVHDVTPQVLARRLIEQAKNAVDNERANFQNLFKQTPEMVCILKGPEHLFVFVNEAHIRLLGFDATGKTVREAQPESIEVHGILDRVYRTGVTAELSEIPVTVGDKLRYFNLTYAASKDMNGKIDGIMILGTEITEQFENRQKLTEDQKRYQILFDFSPLPKWILDLKTEKIVGVNYAAAHLYGYTKEEFVGMNASVLRPAEDLDAYRENLKADFSAVDQTHLRRVRHKKKDGSVIEVEATSLDLKIDGRLVRIAAMVDITQQKQLMETAENARKDAEAASQAKTRFLANMSHEIRTPLSSMVGFSDLLKARVLNDDEAQSYVERISRNAIQLGRLIDELLDLSKIEAEKIEIENTIVDTKSLIEDVFSTLTLKAQEKGLQLNFHWSSEQPTQIITDPIRLSQILTNVVGNAVKFTERGSVDVDLHLQDHALIVRVEDTGIGLTPAQQARIFEPFMQADSSVTRKYGGTGLGLALSKKLTHLLGGDLILEKSTFGQGSVFRIEVKIQKAAETKKATPTNSLEKNVFGKLAGKRLLVVDDAEDNRLLVSLFLRETSAHITEAANGKEAVQIATSEPFDLILMDIQMPLMDGYQALAELKKRNYQKPVVALTAHAFKEERDRCLKAGFASYITKPINKANLIQSIYDLVLS